MIFAKSDFLFPIRNGTDTPLIFGGHILDLHGVKQGDINELLLLQNGRALLEHLEDVLLIENRWKKVISCIVNFLIGAPEVQLL